MADNHESNAHVALLHSDINNMKDIILLVPKRSLLLFCNFFDIPLKV